MNTARAWTLQLTVACGLLFQLTAHIPLRAQEPAVPSHSDEEVTPIPPELLLPVEDGGLDPSLVEPLSPLESQPARSSIGNAFMPAVLPGPANMPDLPPLLAPSGNAHIPVLPEIPGVELPDAPLSQDTALPSSPTLPMPAGRPQTNQTLKMGDGSGLFETAERFRYLPSPREARRVSIAETRPMVMVIAGFEWSPSCKALNSSLLSAFAFQNMLRRNNAVACQLNVPSKRASEDPNKEAQWKAILRYREFLAIKGLPTIIVFNPEGKELNRMVGFSFSKSKITASLMDRMNGLSLTLESETSRLKKDTIRRQVLIQDQGYRDWTSITGSSLFAKICGQPAIPAPTPENPNATVPGICLMDKEGREKNLPVDKLAELDKEYLEIYNAERQAKRNHVTAARTAAAAIQRASE